jgi:hypothetical protein
VTVWDSEDEEPITELMEDIFHALDRLEQNNRRSRRESSNTISV